MRKINTDLVAPAEEYMRLRPEEYVRLVTKSDGRYVKELIGSLKEMYKTYQQQFKEAMEAFEEYECDCSHTPCHRAKYYDQRNKLHDIKFAMMNMYENMALYMQMKHIDNQNEFMRELTIDNVEKHPYSYGYKRVDGE